jgi:hypothetical protein
MATCFNKRRRVSSSAELLPTSEEDPCSMEQGKGEKQICGVENQKK